MSIKLSIFIIISFLSLIKGDIYRNRHDNYKATFDCLGDGKGEEDSDAKSSIQTPEDCFEESPLTKYECCYFEYDVGNETNKDWKTGCMKIYKDDEEDLNDLKYYVSKLSPNTVFNCRQSYLQINFIIVIILLALFII